MTTRVDSEVGAEFAPTVAGPAEVGDAPPPLVERGTSIGHFLVLDTLGAGGMGVVVGAYDPRLDRRVAIKILRPGVWRGASASEGAQRLVREAKAMAKLAHPNVVTVYEVGRFGEGVFLAMEYVDGETMSAWCAGGARSVEEILAVFSQAGRGLAAAHASGMVHRDFKPDNVMVARDGRVLVGDFGLASTGAIEVGASADEPSSLEGSLTRTGTVVGTPRFMAPEQHTGGEVSARADQFAFCVALYRAVHGRWPFDGDDLATYRRNVVEGRMSDQRSDGVPAWLDAILRRGLDPQPERRFDSMDQVVAALSRKRLGAWWLAAAGALAAIAVTAVIWFAGTEREPDPCAGLERAAAPGWDRAGIAAAFARSDRAYAAESARRTLATLDGYAGEIAAMRVDSCRSTHVRHEQSEALLDVRTACLDRRSGELDALASALVGGDADALDRASDAAAELTRVSVCADREALLAAIPPPADPIVAARVTELRAGVAQAEALLRIGRYADGLERLAPIGDEAAGLGYAALLAEVLHLRGTLEKSEGRRAEDVAATYEAAAVAAADAGDDALLATIWIELATLVGHHLSLQHEGARLATVATTATHRAGRPDHLMANLAAMRAALHYEAGRYAEARAEFQQAYDRRRELYGTDDPRTLSTLRGVISASRDAGDYEGALALDRQRLEQERRVRGPDHPAVADALASTGVSLDALGRTEEALEMFERSLALREKALGPDHPAVAGSLNSIAIVLSNRGRNQEALGYHYRALEHRQRTHAEGHPAIANSINNIGTTLDGLGRREEALEQYRRALELRRKAYGDDHPEVAATHNNLGVTLKRLERYEEAFHHYAEALHIRERILGDRHPKVGESLNNLAILAHVRKRYREARELYLRALAIFDGTIGTGTRRTLVTRLYYGQMLHEMGSAGEAADVLESAVTSTSAGTDPEVQRELELALAKALWDARRDRARARVLALGVRDRLVAADDRVALAAVDRWLKAHGGVP